MDRALLLVGQAGRLRRSDLVALDVEDIDLGHSGMTLRASRTGLLARTVDTSVCPVVATEEWLDAAEFSGGPLFRPIDRFGRLLLSLVVKRWDEEGRAVVAWEWEQNGLKKRWDAALGPAEQRRLGRALVAVCAFPLFVLFTIFAGAGLTWLLLPLALPATFWGVWAIMRLKRETAGP